MHYLHSRIIFSREFTILVFESLNWIIIMRGAKLIHHTEQQAGWERMKEGGGMRRSRLAAEWWQISFCLPLLFEPGRSILFTFCVPFAALFLFHAIYQLVCHTCDPVIYSPSTFNQPGSAIHPITLSVFLPSSWDRSVPFLYQSLSVLSFIRDLSNFRVIFRPSFSVSRPFSRRNISMSTAEWEWADSVSSLPSPFPFFLSSLCSSFWHSHSALTFVYADRIFPYYLP